MAKLENKKSPREYMQLAIEVMNKSVNEPRPDGKIPPKVGAVLVFPNGKVETAYRGELREGDHAEFTLLERKLGTKNLEECVLYTTLEPCVKRNPPKVPCCRRTTNARIKKVYVGIEDKDPTVDGKGIKHLEDSFLEVRMFDRDLQKVIEIENEGFLKQALTRKKKSKSKDLRSSIEKPITNYNVGKFSDKALQKFIDEGKLDFTIDDENFLEYLEDFGAMEWSEEKKEFIPTGYGILLFGKDPRRKFQNAVLKAHVIYGKSKTEPKDFSDALVLIPDQVEEWLLKVLPLSKDTSEFKRKEVADFPITVLREAIVNAIVHRNYEIEGAKCEIKIDDDKIVVTSPGKPLPAISLEQLNSFEAPSLSRNPIITYAFSLMDYVEEKGFGMQTFKSLNEEFGLPIPKYTYKEPFLFLTFPRSSEALKRIDDTPGLSELNDEELRGLDWIRVQGEVSRRQYANHFDFGSKKAQRHLTKMRDLILIEDNGEPITSPNYGYVAKK